MKLTWFGTACFALECGADRILFDPFLELAGGAYAADPGKLLEYDTIFVTHCHFDHLSTALWLLEEGEGEASIFCTGQCCETLEGFLEDTSNIVQIEAGRIFRIGSIAIDVLKGRHIEFQWRHIFDTMTPPRVLRYAGNLPYLFWANRTFREAGESVVFHISEGNSPVRAEGTDETSPKPKRPWSSPVRPEGTDDFGRGGGLPARSKRDILLLGSLALDPGERYPEGVDVLILPYQGSNDLPKRAREVLERLRPKSVVLSHFDNAFPPMSRNVDLRPLKRMMEREFPGVRVVKPTAGKEIEI